jgi:hypothetical protein
VTLLGGEQFVDGRMWLRRIPANSEDVHPEGGSEFGDPPADRSDADDPERLRPQFASRKAAPFVAPLLFVALAQPPLEVQHQGKDVFGDGACVDAGDCREGGIQVGDDVEVVRIGTRTQRVDPS